jgi:hypothetical protein
VDIGEKLARKDVESALSMSCCFVYSLIVISVAHLPSTSFERRALPVADYIWIARERNAARDNVRRELVLDIVVERKRFDDLAETIKDKSNRCANDIVSYIVTFVQISRSEDAFA